ncbi:uncharacterized protein [Mycetomoellerius zeteki]|uniref:uncharacterized protein n=1 Tax=Mycetomoellerius zeteki TaxID=64791 RepID=UPI00084E6E40|nr:PREDICTED: uncharacterized protein LOC108722191 [Trachymyrmex zeteki]
MANNDDITMLKRRRAIITGSCTRVRTFADSIESVTSAIAAQLEERRSKLDGYWSNYDEVQTKLELSDEAEANHRVTFEEAFYSTSARLRELLYLSLIHANASLNNIQKLQYLKTSLTGDAAKVIGTLKISGVNYAVAWSLLKDRYDNKRVIVQNHVKALKRPTAHWDDLLVHILSGKLDTLTSREWRLSLTSSELPTLKQLIDFISHRCQTLEANEKPALPVSQRISEIRKRKIYINCLRSSDHTSSACPSGSCKTCNSKHNSLLHLIAVNSTKSDTSESHNSATNEREGAIPAISPTTLVANSANSPAHNCVMLSTAVVSAYDCKGARKSCRVLLDCGSQANFISQRFLETLGLKTRASDISISGINKTATRSFRTAELRLQSRINSFNMSLDCIVTDHVTDKLPAFTLKRSTFEIPQNIELADPQFNIASEIDVLIGADHFWNLLCVGQIKSSPAHPTLHKTRFGWILAGRFDKFLKI